MLIHGDQHEYSTEYLMVLGLEFTVHVGHPWVDLAPSLAKGANRSIRLNPWIEWIFPPLPRIEDAGKFQEPPTRVMRC